MKVLSTVFPLLSLSLSILSPLVLGAPAKLPKCGPITPSALPLTPKSELPALFNQAPTKQSAEAILARVEATTVISNKLALTAIATDAKNFAALGSYFQENAIANLAVPGPAPQVGRANIISTYEKALKPYDTQLTLGTTVVKVYEEKPRPGEPESFNNPGPCQASSVTYFTTSFFGTGANKGKNAIIVGDFRDRWAKDAKGNWKIIARRQVVTNLVVGELAV